jgi:hypothetical protein
LIDGIFVFDNVIHAYDMSDENLRPDVWDSELARAQMVGALGPPRRQSPEALSRRWDPKRSTRWCSKTRPST